MYSHSTKAQLIKPRKVYSIDLGLIEFISIKLAKDSMVSLSRFQPHPLKINELSLLRLYV